MRRVAPSVRARPRVLEFEAHSFDLAAHGGLKSPQGNQGNNYLRAAIGKHIALTRAVASRPDDILVTSGAQQAFDLLARTLVTPNDTIGR